MVAAEQRGQTDERQRPDHEMMRLRTMPIIACGMGVRSFPRAATELFAHGTLAGTPLGPHLVAETPPSFVMVGVRVAVMPMESATAAARIGRRVVAMQGIFLLRLLVDGEIFADANAEFAHQNLLMAQISHHLEEIIIIISSIVKLYHQKTLKYQ
ncbi:MAG: hypothetical protein KGL56_13810 [Alphaproteobacteria bacterium]|nr:hypothetical protein [Alphaproteobacteria bacterium]